MTIVKLGSLSAAEESGPAGSRALGWDRRGGASYGIYQIAQRVGTLRRFVEFCEREFPEVGARLRAETSSAAANSRARMRRTRFTAAWLALADEGKIQPAEHAFIKATHYDVAFRGLRHAAQERVSGSPTLQDVLWSTAVQHGPGGGLAIFNRTWQPGRGNAAWIKAIYAERARRFPPTRARYQRECRSALALLENENTIV